MIRLYGRAEGKNRVYDKVKHKAEIKLTLISGLSINGLVSPYEFDGYLDQHIFYYYLKDFLLPEMKKGQVLLLDNLSSHKGELIENILSEKGIKVIYFPAYSPNLNPIEKYWSILKSYLRKWCGRTKKEVQENLTKAIKIIEQSCIINLFKSSWNM
jgi:transposase